MIPLCEFGALIDKKQEILLEGHTAPVVSVFITSNGNHIISASDDNTARVWNLQSQAQEALLEFPSSLKSVIISSDSLLLVSASFEKAIRIWDTFAKATNRRTKGPHWLFTESLSITSESDFIVSGSVDKGSIRIWDVKKSHQEAILEGHTGPVWSVLISTDRRYIVSCSVDKTVRLWSFKEKYQEAVFAGHTRYVNFIGSKCG